MFHWKTVGCILVVGILGASLADDQFTCCMKGIKVVRGEALCPAPCCPGYREYQATPPFLGEVVYCKKKQFLCCMKGWKRVRDLMLCPAPCCPGYIERIAFPPNLQPLIYCVKKEPLENPVITYQ